MGIPMNSLYKLQSARPLRLRTVFATLLFTLCVAGTAHAFSCDVPPPTVSVVASDAPDCLELASPEYGRPIFLNACETTYTLDNVAWALYLPYGPEDHYIEGELRLEPGQRAEVDTNYVEGLGWRSDDGETGFIELEYIDHGDACGSWTGCDVAAADAAPGGSTVLFGLLVLLGLTRRRR